MRRVLIVGLVGFILGNLWQPVSAQVAQRIYGTLSGTLTSTQTPQAIAVDSNGLVLVQGF